MQLVVDPLAVALRQELQTAHDAASAPEPAPKPPLEATDIGAQSMSPSGKWELVFSRQSRH